jgi:hypothetical protein
MASAMFAGRGKDRCKIHIPHRAVTKGLLLLFRWPKDPSVSAHAKYLLNGIVRKSHSVTEFPIVGTNGKCSL